MTPEQIEELKALNAAATKGILSTAERYVASEYIECPACNGSGELEASDYCNFDGKALGVQFYGIGPEFGAHERLWTFLRNLAPSIIAMAEENARLRDRVAETPLYDHPAPQPDVERMAFAMWKAEAMRAAPNVGKHRTLEHFQSVDMDRREREKWVDLARAALASMKGEG